MADQGFGSRPISTGTGCLAVVGVVGAAALGVALFSGGSHKPKQVSPLSATEQAAEQQRSARAAAKKSEDDAAAADRKFKSNAEVHAQMHVHEALIKARGAAMPDKWAERGEMIRREGDYALVLVRTGIKEGMLSPLINVQAYLVSVRMNMPGDKVFLSAAHRCDDPPDPAVVGMMMVKNGWPSVADAMQHMRDTIDASAKKAKPRRAAPDSE
jgi:hypothetical protein